MGYEEKNPSPIHEIGADNLAILTRFMLGWDCVTKRQSILYRLRPACRRRGIWLAKVSPGNTLLLTKYSRSIGVLRKLSQPLSVTAVKMIFACSKKTMPERLKAFYV